MSRSVRMILALAQMFFSAGAITPNKGDLILLTTGAKVVYCGNGWYKLTHSYTPWDMKQFIEASKYKSLKAWQYEQDRLSRKAECDAHQRGGCVPSPARCWNCQHQPI